MKKLFSLICLLLSFSFVSCSNVEYISLKSKPEKTYYLQEVKKIENIDSIKIIENNFFKEIDLKQEDFKIITDLIAEIKPENFIETADLNSSNKSLFRLYLKGVSESRYVIDIYGDDILSIYPWDGVYEKEFYDLKNIPLSLKPESICQYIFKN